MITTLVGNYPKVAERAYGTTLIGAITKWQRKEINDEALESTYREITRAVMREQEQAGLDLLTDGQIRWEDLVTPVARRLEGFEINGLSRWFNNNVYYRRPILRKAPRRTGPILVEDYRFAASCTTRPVKAILPGPYTFTLMSEDRFYKSERSCALKLAELLNAEALALVEAGAPFVQFDEPALGRGKPNVKLAIEALGVAIKGVKAKTGLYTYFGSLDGALEPLMRTKIDVIGLDVVSEPKAVAGLKRTKITKELALGCLDARNTKLESVTELHALFDVIRKLVSPECLYVNPNCGLEFLPHSQARAKVRQLVKAVTAYNT